MSFKRVLIIQTDDVYFLHETLRVLADNSPDLRDRELTLLVSPKSLDLVRLSGCPLPEGVTTDIEKVRNQNYDISFNLSLNEASWEIHGQVKAAKKAGPFYEGNELRVSGAWSTWFLTFKGNTPFVTFHMREIFRNILGLQKKSKERSHASTIRTLIMGLSNPDFFPNSEQEAFLSGLVRRFPGIQVMDESEVRTDHDHSASFYVGPASLKSLLLNEGGARGLVISSRFQGLNLLPEAQGVHLLTTSGKKMEAKPLLDVAEALLKDQDPPRISGHALYRVDRENVFGAYLECVSGEEISYPFYQAHVVLWNYLLSLQDVNLDIKCPSGEQATLLGSQMEIVTKLLRLHDYAMISLDGIYKEARNSQIAPEKVQKNLNTLTEVDETFDKIAETNPFLRPLLDFYKIRKGQTEGESLLERSQNSLLTYTEEHQALKAFEELLSIIQNKR